ncbi:MAG: methyltransferase domain-containing protein [Planctomycetota bacterium]|nr:methyltransferase domain-containing protein [Planctomycetota bacterium]
MNPIQQSRSDNQQADNLRAGNSTSDSILDGIEYEMGIPIPGKILPPEEWAKTAIKKLPPPEPLNFQSIFGRSAPVVLDLGCGNGRFVLSSALRRREVDHLGLDILPMVIRYATRRGNQRGLHNARFAVCGAFQFLEHYVAPESISEIHIYHPQPYHSPHDRKLRLLTPDFLGIVHRALQADGKLYLQTDNVAYWKYLQSVVSQIFDWTERESPWEDEGKIDPYGRSRREAIAIEKGLPIFRSESKRRNGWISDNLESLIDGLPLPTFAASDEKSSEAKRRPWSKPTRRRR